MRLIVRPDGTIHGIYDETIDVTLLGHVQITRASHVEPDAAGEWWADLSPVSGPKLGPFALRSQALAAERRWLEEHWLQAAKHG